MGDAFKRKLADMEDLDEKVFSNKPWVQNLLDNAIKLTTKAIFNWSTILCKIGETGIDLDQYTSIFLHQMETLYEDLIADLDTIHEKTLDKIAQLLQQLQDLCRDLHVSMPPFDHEKLSLDDLYKVVQKKVQEYDSLAEIRRNEVKELNQKQLRLCKRMGKKPMPLQESPLALQKDVDAARVYIDKLENEALELEERFFLLKEEIVQMVEELKTPPTLDFEKAILNLSNTEVRITKSEMEELELFHSRLEKQCLSVREEMDELRRKIEDLWKKLETDIAERDSFRKKYTGNSLETLNAFRQEVKKLEEMKKANIKGFILKQREELCEIWEQCHCSEDDKRQFLFFNSQCFNEDLFEIHEREIEKWKNYYEENKEIFRLLQEHKNLWKEHLELELNSGGANRYKNRGGQLLLEEKQRNKLKKQIPKIEDKLLKLSETYRIHKNKPFLISGETIQDYVDKLHKEEDKEFKLKLSAKKQKREQVNATGRSRMNLFPCSSIQNPSLTPRQRSKRKIITTPMTEPMKKSKYSTQKKIPQTGLPKVNVSVNKRRSTGRERLRKRLSMTTSRNSDKENHNETASTSYDKFVEEFSVKKMCRSTEFGVQNNVQVPTIVVSPVMEEMERGFGYLQKTPKRE